MITFIISALLILIACLALIIRPLISNTDPIELTRDKQNITFAQTRLAELNNQLKNNDISIAEYDALKLEIETTLLQDIDLNSTEETSCDTTVNSAQTNDSSNAVLITLLCTLIPFIGLLLYLITGTPAAINLNNLITQASIENPLAEGEDIDAMIAVVKQRLTDQPDDLEGWLILTRTYTALGRYQEALEANLQLLTIGGENPMVLTQLADTTALLANGEITPAANVYINKALKLDTNYPQALWLAGLSAVQNNNKDEAQAYWNTLLPLLDNAPQQQEELRGVLAQMTDSQVIPEKNTENTQSVEAQDIEIQSSETNAQKIALTIDVSVDTSVLDQVNQDHSVFVFAKAKNGPPAPLAVKRLTVSDLPIQIKLSDNDAMIEQFKLSLFEEVIISARISKSGNPIPQVGDIESAVITTKNTNTSNLKLIISNVVEKR